MDPEKMISIGCRILFSVSLLLLIAAIGERLANLIGYTFLQHTAYLPWRLLEIAAIFLIFVIAILLRQIREELRQQKKN